MSTHEQDSLRVVQEMYGAFGRGDAASLLDAISPNVDWMVAGPVSVPLCGPRRGRDAVAQFFSMLGETMETQRFEPQEFITQGGDVVVLGHERHRVRATGRIFEGEWVHVFRVRDGEVVRFREYLDTAALQAALAVG